MSKFKFPQWISSIALNDSRSLFDAIAGNAQNFNFDTYACMRTANAHLLTRDNLGICDLNNQSSF